jgi:hypothetical protein
LFDFAGKLYISGMTGSGGQDVCFNGHSDKCHIAHNIEKLVSGRFILKMQLNIVENSFLLNFNMRFLKQLSQFIKLLLRDGSVNNYNGVIQISTLYKIVG